jgi:hypothetical protein
VTPQTVMEWLRNVVRCSFLQLSRICTDQADSVVDFRLQAILVVVWWGSTPLKFTSWRFAQVANRLSSSGAQWAKMFARYNSGTYNNRTPHVLLRMFLLRGVAATSSSFDVADFMVLDYKLFTPGKPLAPNTLWIIEQIPGNSRDSLVRLGVCLVVLALRRSVWTLSSTVGMSPQCSSDSLDSLTRFSARSSGMVESADMTSFVSTNLFWPSFNVAYFPWVDSTPLS